MKRKENKFKKVIASIALWVFGATQILQWVAYANSFNIEWIDMNVINNSSSNNWGWTNWWWVSQNATATLQWTIEYKLAESTLLTLVKDLISKWIVYKIWDINNDNVPDLVVENWKCLNIRIWPTYEIAKDNKGRTCFPKWNWWWFIKDKDWKSKLMSIEYNYLHKSKTWSIKLVDIDWQKTSKKIT